MACEHPSSLIYFDKYNAACVSWEICDECGVKFNYQVNKSAEEIADDARFEEWARQYRYNGTIDTC